MAKAKDLKKGAKVSINETEITVTNVDVSKIAKHGQAKCRIEGIDKNKQKKVFIVLADQDL
jgi:translation elongation factor P/translation initiation factor 5A